MIRVCNNLARPPIRLGITFFEAADVLSSADPIHELLVAYCESREATADVAERRRKDARDMLRNGRFKPTGRSKPASEYLLRTIAEEGAAGFPRINPVVDVANFISLTTQTPISLWDLDKADAKELNFRHGVADESYVFNTAGHVIDLHDLAIGSIKRDGPGSDIPIINPVKDSMLTKTDDGSRRFGLVIYSPQSTFSREELSSLLDKLSQLLSSVTRPVGYVSFTLDPGETQTIDSIPCL